MTDPGRRRPRPPARGAHRRWSPSRWSPSSPPGWCRGPGCPADPRARPCLRRCSPRPDRPRRALLAGFAARARLDLLLPLSARCCWRWRSPRRGCAAGAPGRRGADAGGSACPLGVLVVLAARSAWSTLPFAVASHVVDRDYGISRQGGAAGWATRPDRWASRGSRRRWCCSSSSLPPDARRGGGSPGPARPRCVLRFAGSFLYPVVVEPLFNRFTPMAAGPFKSRSCGWRTTRACRSTTCWWPTRRAVRRP